MTLEIPAQCRVDIALADYPVRLSATGFGMRITARTGARKWLATCKVAQKCTGDQPRASSTEEFPAGYASPVDIQSGNPIDREAELRALLDVQGRSAIRLSRTAITAKIVTVAYPLLVIGSVAFVLFAGLYRLYDLFF